jgi:beta-lactamase class A
MPRHRVRLALVAAVLLVAGAATYFVVRPRATTPQEAVAAAVAAGRSRGVRVGVAVLDLHTGAFYGGGDVNGQFASASVMKVFIATSWSMAGPTIRTSEVRCGG